MGASQIMNFSVLNELIYLLSTRVLSSVFDTQVIGFKAPSIFFKDSCKSGFPKKSQNNLRRKKDVFPKSCNSVEGRGVVEGQYTYNFNFTLYFLIFFFTYSQKSGGGNSTIINFLYWNLRKMFAAGCRYNLNHNCDAICWCNLKPYLLQSTMTLTSTWDKNTWLSQ